MIDIHTHILPGLDDGSDNQEDSLSMVRMAAESGVRAIVATPHCNQEGSYDNFYTEELKRAYHKLDAAIKAEGLEIMLLLGMEIYYSEDLPEKIKSGKVIGLNGSCYYLVEFPFDISPQRFRDSLYDILNPGHVVPVIAHPERYYCVQRDPQMIYRLVMDGCLPQINKGSLSGRFGRETFYTAMELLEHNLVFCVASDAHTPYIRTTHMKETFEFLSQQYSDSCARLLLDENPEKLVCGHKADMRPYARRVQREQFRQMRRG